MLYLESSTGANELLLSCLFNGDNSGYGMSERLKCSKRLARLTESQHVPKQAGIWSLLLTFLKAKRMPSLTSFRTIAS